MSMTDRGGGGHKSVSKEQSYRFPPGSFEPRGRKRSERDRYWYHNDKSRWGWESMRIWRIRVDGEIWSWWEFVKQIFRCPLLSHFLGVWRWANSLAIYALVSLIHKMFLPNGAVGRIEGLAPSIYTVKSPVLFMLLLEQFLHYCWETNYSIGHPREDGETR